jgi:hypothetical protein
MLKKLIFFIFTSVIMITTGCDDTPSGKENKQDSAYAKGSFGYDLSFLKSKGDVIVLADSSDQAKLIVSAKYQAKVFTSTADGDSGQSFGWINYKAFTGAPNAHMNGYGGENRFWLGPEGGRYSLFFPKGSKMDFDHWKTPAAFDTEAWNVISQNRQQVSLQKNMDLVNYAGSTLQITVDRVISILARDQMFSQLNLEPDAAVKAVGYEARNKITNAGKMAWTEKTGMPCIWMLDMFNPSEKTVILIPYQRPADTASKIATTNYFGEIPADRLKHKDGMLYFKADGKSRGKLGLDPTRATRFIGSYDALHQILTIAHFDLDPSAKFLNQEWNTEKPPFSGDAVNAYNDGPLADGSQMGPFYEMESVSPAAWLKPGESLEHQHSVFHFTGPESALDKITESVFHISIDEIKSAFQ